MKHGISPEILQAGLELRDLTLWEDINDQIGAFFTGAVYVAEEHNSELQEKIERLEQALEDIFLDDGGFLAGDPARWPCYRAAKALLGRELTQEEFKIYQQQLLAKRKIEGE